MSALALVIVAGLVGSPSVHATTYRDLCGSVPSACQYTGPEAPELATAVCWNHSASITTLMTGASCPTGSWPYFAKYGVVDPLTLQVSAFLPLDDACSRPGFCQPGSFAPPNVTPVVICCFGDTCYPSDGECYGGELWYCADGVTNDDGTVTCFQPF